MESLTKREEAYIIHNRIMTNGKVLQTALYEVCKDLKEMRDTKLYIELGYESFESYAERACGIKQRQAYSYISVIENLGPEFVKDNISLGITKLELIGQLPSYERDEFIENNDIEDVSTRELKEQIKEFKKQTEQLTLDLEKADEGYAELVAEKNKIEAELKEERQNKEIVVQPSPEPDAAAIEKIKNDLAQQYEKEKKTAVKEAKEKATEQLKKKLEKLEADKAASESKLAEAVKAAKLSNADEDTVAIRFLFNDLQSTANNIEQHLRSLMSRDDATAMKLAAAMQQTLYAIADKYRFGK